jgi:predicted aconitase
MQLTVEERDILDGKQAEVMAKAMRTIVRYRELFGAERRLPLDAPIHVVTSMGMAGPEAVFDLRSNGAATAPQRVRGAGNSRARWRSVFWLQSCGVR